MNSIVIGAATSGAATHREHSLKLAFEGYVFDEVRRELTRGSEAITVGPQVFDLLAYLLRNRTRVVSKDDMIDAVWGGRIVSDSTLTSHINAVRKAVGDTGEEQRLVRTIARKGYRFVGEVREGPDSARPPESNKQSTAQSAEQPTAHSSALALVLPDRPSIAVLPFTNMSGDPEQAYFSDGMTEDLITELSRFRCLFVIARNSSFQFRDTAVDVKRVGRELGVQYLVEGSVRRANNRVRVTAQLIDARTGNHLWAERFDREFADIFAVQDEVTTRIVTSIQPVLDAEQLRMAKRKPPEDMQAYEYLLKAKELLAARSSEELRDARALCDHALRIDPTFARAYAFRSMTFALGVGSIEADDLNEWRRQALLSAERAVALDTMDSTNHLALAWGSFLNLQRDRTLAHCAKAISLNPNDANILVDAAHFYACCGHPDRALQHLEAARERNPSSLAYYSWASGCLFYLLGRYGDAIAAFEGFGEPNENIHLWRAASLVKLGRNAEAQTDVQAVRTLRPRLTVAMALDVFSYLPDCDDFVGALRQAGLPEDGQPLAPAAALSCRFGLRRKQSNGAGLGRINE